MVNISNKKLNEIFDAGLIIQKAHYATTDEGKAFNADLTPANLAAAEIATLLLDNKEIGGKPITATYLNAHYASEQNKFMQRLELRPTEREANDAAKANGEEAYYKVDLIKFEHDGKSLTVPANIFSSETLQKMKIFEMPRASIAEHYANRPANDLNGMKEEEISTNFHESIRIIARNNTMNKDNVAAVIGLLNPKMLPPVDGHYMGGKGSIDKIMPHEAEIVFNKIIVAAKSANPPHNNIVTADNSHGGKIAPEKAKEVGGLGA